MTKKRKRYDDKFRASAVVMLQAAGYPSVEGALTRVAKQLNTPARTLSRWFNGEQNPPPDQLVIEKRGDVVDWIKAEIAAIFTAMPAAREEASYRDLGTVFGILTDKQQLLAGKPTERIENVEQLSDSERRERLAGLFNSARTRGTGTPARTDD